MQLSLLPDLLFRRARAVPPPVPVAPAVPGGNALADRLFRLGLAAGTAVRLTRNRTVLVSWHPRSGLRLHAGFAAAPDAVLSAIVRFLARRVPRAERTAARRIFMSFPVEQHVPSRPGRPRTPRAVPLEDGPLIDRLEALRAEFNARYFEGALPAIPVRLSYRMRSRLGELRSSRSGVAVEITISRRHIRRDGWNAVSDTLLHELVHQWQAENGHPLDHGREFRRKAKAVGISPRAVADLSSPRRNS